VATYELEPGARYLLARAEDLLYLPVDFDSDTDKVCLTLPVQHVAELPSSVEQLPFSLPADPYGVLSIGADGTWNRLMCSPPDGEPSTWVPGLLGTQQAEWMDAELHYPTFLHLRSRGRSKWRLHPEPRTGQGWTAVWQAELLTTEEGLPEMGGTPMFEVAYVEPIIPFAFQVWPFTVYGEFPNAWFETKLALSMLGASGRLHGPHRPFPVGAPGPTVTDYTHATQFGRDTFVHGTAFGHLSSGHRARVDTELRRVFTRMHRNDPLAVVEPPHYAAAADFQACHLVSVSRLTVLEEVVTASHVETPWRSLRLTGGNDLRVDPPTDVAYWLAQGGNDVRFGLLGTDWDGSEVPFSTPLMFIPDGATELAAEAYVQDARGRLDLQGRPVALADRDGRDAAPRGSVTLPVHGMWMTLGEVDGRPALKAARAEVALEAVQRLSGDAATSVATLRHALDEAGTFLVLDDPLRVDLPAQSVGGLAAPTSVLGSVSALTGVVPVPSVAEAFGQARLLGASLVDLLTTDQPVPELRTVELPDRIETRYLWEPKLDPNAAAGFLTLGVGAVLHLEANVTQALAQGAVPRATMNGQLTRVALRLLGGLVIVRIAELRFDALPDSSPTVVASGVEVEFGDTLKLVQDLADVIEGFPAGCPIDVTADGIGAHYAFAPGDIGVGVLSLRNLSLAARVWIPFVDGPATVRFAFGEPHAPFTVGVGIFGGGGHVGVSGSSRGDIDVDISLEFGGNFDISVAVASGRVFAMGGIAFVMGTVNEIEGYLRCGGHLEVLDLVGVSVEFRVGLAYTYAAGTGGVLSGSASVTVGVELLGFEESVTFEVSQSFPVGPGPSTAAHDVAELYDEASWAELCAAFVVEPS